MKDKLPRVWILWSPTTNGAKPYARLQKNGSEYYQENDIVEEYLSKRESDELLSEAESRGRALALQEYQSWLLSSAEPFFDECTSDGCEVGESFENAAMRVKDYRELLERKARAGKRDDDELLSEGLHEAFCIVRDYSVEAKGQCNCRLRNKGKLEGGGE